MFSSNKKLGLKWTLNELWKLFRKKPAPKNKQFFKIKVKLPHVNKKPLARKRFFVDEIHYSNDFKNHENMWTDFKKTAPQYNSNSLNCRK